MGGGKGGRKNIRPVQKHTNPPYHLIIGYFHTLQTHRLRVARVSTICKSFSKRRNSPRKLLLLLFFFYLLWLYNSPRILAATAFDLSRTRTIPFEFPSTSCVFKSWLTPSNRRFLGPLHGRFPTDRRSTVVAPSVHTARPTRRYRCSLTITYRYPRGFRVSSPAPPVRSAFRLIIV